MSAKNRDARNRWRSVTIAFRVSPEENESINLRVRLSGLTKQEYLIRRCQERDVVVQGNPRVFRALKGSMTEILDALHARKNAGALDEAQLETLEMIVMTLEGLNKKEDNHG